MFFELPVAFLKKPPILKGSQKNSMANTATPLDIKPFQLHEGDTGSADVQIALITARINYLTEHLKAHVKDHHSRYGLLKLVAQRRSLLDYLKRTAAERYKAILEKLNLRR